MSAADPYVTVHRRILDDPTYADVVDDPALLGWWLKLRLAADGAWPASADIPASCPPATITALSAAGLLVMYPRSRFRMPEYDDEREDRARAGAVGGHVRAGAASRDTSGRYQRIQPAVAGSDRTSDEPQPLNATQPRATQKVPTARDGANGWSGWPAAWDRFREEWTKRGFRLPPTTRQREALWPAVDARPGDVGRWVAQTPPDATAAQVVRAVLAHWGRFRAGNGAAPP